MLVDVSDGGYRFLPGGTAYSSGVVAQPGFAVVHAVLRAPLPYAEGFALAKRHLAGIGRPLAALCAVELRVREPLSFDGFAEFNQEYVALLRAEGLLIDDKSPLARTNVAQEPVALVPAQASLF